MKRLPYILILVAAVFLTAGCSHDDAPNDVQTAEKTLFVYMPWTAGASRPYSESLYDYFTSNISDIEAAIKSQGGLGNNRLMVFISQSPTSSTLLEISYEANRCVRDTLKRYTAYDYTTPAGLAGILTDVKTLATANSYAMIIGSHGTGWIPKGINDYYRTRSFGGSEEKYQMETADLATAITMAAMHMQFILFDDCYMAGIEVAYDLRNATDYLVASTSEVMAIGIPYQQVFKYLCAANPNYQTVVDGFYNFYSKYTYPYGTLSAINCGVAEEMAGYMADANSRYTFDEGLTGELQKLDGFAQTTFFDMGSYISALCSDTDEQGMLLSCLQRLVPYKACTPYIYTSLYNYNGGIDKIAVDKFSGITISDPTTNTFVVNRKSETAWWQATHR